MSTRDFEHDALQGVEMRDQEGNLVHDLDSWTSSVDPEARAAHYVGMIGVAITDVNAMTDAELALLSYGMHSDTEAHLAAQQAGFDGAFDATYVGREINDQAPERMTAYMTPTALDGMEASQTFAIAGALIAAVKATPAIGAWAANLVGPATGSLIADVGAAATKATVGSRVLQTIRFMTGGSITNPWARNALRATQGLIGTTALGSTIASILDDPEVQAAADAEALQIEGVADQIMGGTLWRGGGSATRPLNPDGTVGDAEDLPDWARPDMPTSSVSSEQALEDMRYRIERGSAPDQLSARGRALFGEGIAARKQLDELYGADEGVAPVTYEHKYAYTYYNPATGKTETRTGSTVTDKFIPVSLGAVGSASRTSGLDSRYTDNMAGPYDESRLFGDNIGLRPGSGSRYREGAAERALANMTPGQMAGFETMAHDAGWLNTSSSSYVPGAANGSAQIKAMEGLMTQGNSIGRDWKTVGRVLADANKAGGGGGGYARPAFQRRTYLKPDYAEVSQYVKNQMERQLGRKRTSAEMNVLADTFYTEHRGQFDAEEAARYAEWQGKGGSTPESTNVMDDVDWESRWQEFFDEKFAGEVERREDVAFVDQATRSLMSGLNNATRSFR